MGPLPSSTARPKSPERRTGAGPRRWPRAGLTAALLWAAVGVAVTRIADGPGPGTRISDGAALLIIVAGVPILGWVGRRQDLHGRAEWVRAATATLGFLAVGVAVVSCIGALASDG